jgi:hypothetical protein
LGEDSILGKNQTSRNEKNSQHPHGVLPQSVGYIGKRFHHKIQGRKKK